MREDIMNRWIAKLNDPENYPQTTGHLCEADTAGKRSFCCWGVLSEVAVEDGIAKREISHMNEGVIRYVDDQDASSIGYPTDRILEWAEIPKMPDKLNDQNIVDYLANANDNGSNFAFIINEIRTYLA